ncbi:MAG: hypothetical protein SWO11_01010 [Thermodesulfobacteriota bacterium]|nr:hypothetical protein [Thermodesulfobacteriota bacterium]
METILHYDAEGLPRESHHDLGKDGKMETFRLYHGGEISHEKK